MTDYCADGKYPIDIQQGATYLLNATWNDSNGAPINLSGYSAEMQVRESYNAIDPPLVEASTTNSDITLGGVLGTVQIKIPATVTATLPTDTEPLYYDLLLTSGSGFVTRLLSGTVFVSPGVTRA